MQEEDFQGEEELFRFIRALDVKDVEEFITQCEEDTIWDDEFSDYAEA